MIVDVCLRPGRESCWAGLTRRPLMNDGSQPPSGSSKCRCFIPQVVPVIDDFQSGGGHPSLRAVSGCRMGVDRLDDRAHAGDEV